MPHFRGTVGQLLINDALPEDMRNHSRVLDKKGTADLFREIAQRYPEQYAAIAKKLADVGRHVATASGGYSFGPEHMQKARAATKISQEIQHKLERILDDDTLPDSKRHALIIRTVGAYQQRQMDEVYEESLKDKNPLAYQIMSGSRGNRMNLNSLRGSDLLYTDHHDNVIPLPVLRSYSEGLTPAEYWAGTYGARKGVLATKFAVQDAGYLCLAGGTLVRMADFGVRAIEQVSVGDEILGADRTGATFPVRVSAVFENGARPLYRFKFRYGKSRSRFVEVTATAEHHALVRHLRRNRRRPDPVLQKTVSVSVLPLGECERRSVSFHSLVPPQGFSDDTYGSNVSWAWFVGLLIGDGGLTTNSLGYSCGDPQLLQLVTEALANDGFTIKQKSGAAYEYCISDRGPGRPNRLRTFLTELGLLGLLAHDKFIPAAVANWDNTSVAALIRGIFDTDGGVATSTMDSMPFLRLGMTAKAVVLGVQELLAERFGIYGQVCRGNTVGRPVNIVPEKGYVAKHDIYSLTIADRTSVERFVTRVGFGSPSKRKRLQILLAQSTTAEREDAFLFHFVDSVFVGDGLTYDLEVEHPDHLFVLANGAIVSNSKQLNQVAHRLIVTDRDGPQTDNTLRGLPVDVTDPDSEGALLARNTGPYKTHTVITPKILKSLERLGHKRILVRSPLVGGSPEGGVYSYDVGVRESGGLPGRGEAVGLLAAQALSEPLTQAQLATKHSGGVAGQEKAVGGFHAINQQIQVPATFQGGAAHAQVDGTVQRVEEAPQGGHYLTIEGQRHYAGHGYGLKVKRGDTVEAGDVLSEGWPNPWEVVHHKGIGEGRRYFVDTLARAYRSAGLKVNRRNLEVLSRGLINHVRLTEETDHHDPDDVVPYSTLEHTYQPREGAQEGHPKRLLGHYLEKPVLHYSIGTRIRPSVLKDLNDFAVDKVVAHKEPPPFQAEMIRGMASLQHDPDWVTRLYGSNLKSSLFDAVHRGGSSTELGTSFVPGLARAVDFGRVGLVRSPEPAIPPETVQLQRKATAAAHEPPKPYKPKDKLASPPGWLKLFKFASEKRADVPVSGAPRPPSGPVPGEPGRPRPASPPAAEPRPVHEPYDPAHDYVAGTASQNLSPPVSWQQQQHQQYQHGQQLQYALARLTGMGRGGGQQWGGPGQGFGMMPSGYAAGGMAQPWQQTEPWQPGQPGQAPGQAPGQSGQLGQAGQVGPGWFNTGLNWAQTGAYGVPLAGLGMQGAGYGLRGTGAVIRGGGALAGAANLPRTAAALTNTGNAVSRSGGGLSRFGGRVARGFGYAQMASDVIGGARAATGGDVEGWDQTAAEARARGGWVQAGNNSSPLQARLDIVNPNATGFERYANQAARNQLEQNANIAGLFNPRSEDFRGPIDNPLTRGGLSFMEMMQSRWNPVSNIAGSVVNANQIRMDATAAQQSMMRNDAARAQARQMQEPAQRNAAGELADLEARVARGETLNPAQQQNLTHLRATRGQSIADRPVQTNSALTRYGQTAANALPRGNNFWQAAGNTVLGATPVRLLPALATGNTEGNPVAWAMRNLNPALALFSALQ